MRRNIPNATNKEALFLIVAIGIIAVPTAVLSQTPNDAPVESPTNEVGWEATVTAQQYDDQGNLIYTHEGENILTNEGANFIRSHLQGNNSNNINYVALTNESSYTTDITHDYLVGEVTTTNLSRKQADAIRDTGTGKWEIEATWVANGSIDGVQGTALFPHDVQGSTDSDANIIIAEETMSSKAFRDGYEFTLTWEIEQTTG